MSEIRYRKLLVEIDKDSDRCIIIGSDKDIKSVTIPAKIQGVPVVEIADNAFENCTNLKSVKFAVASLNNFTCQDDNASCSDCSSCNMNSCDNDNCCNASGDNNNCCNNDCSKNNCCNVNNNENTNTSNDCCYTYDYFDFICTGFRIGSYAFQNCTSLKKIDIPEYVTMIDRGAFHNCTSLVSVTLPDCFVAPYAFYHCSALKEITPISTISEGVFSHCLSLETLPITDKTTEFDEDAFEHCESLKNIVIPKSVKTIGSLAFRSCYGLKSVTFEDPDGWYATNMYTDTEFSLNLSKPENNAKLLSSQDFDDGVTSWYKK